MWPVFRESQKDDDEYLYQWQPVDIHSLTYMKGWSEDAAWMDASAKGPLWTDAAEQAKQNRYIRQLLYGVAY